MKKILLVEDDRLVLATMAGGLRDAGHEVLEASNGEAALRLCEEQRPDLVILDVRLPGISGIEIAERLAESCDIPFIFLTAFDDQKIVKSAVELGAMGYLIKPIDLQQLLPAVEAVLGRALDLKQLRDDQGHLRIALAQKRETSMAIGVLMERHGLSADDAFALLRDSARSQRRKVVDLAAEIISASEVLNLAGKSGGRQKLPE